MKRDPALRSGEWKHHDKACGAPIEAVGRDHDRGANKVLLVAFRRTKINRPDFTA